MLETKTITSLQISNKVNDSFSQTITLDACEDAVRLLLSDKINEIVSKDKNASIRKQYKSVTLEVIKEYIRDATPRVEGFINDKGEVELNKLETSLINNFVRKGPIQPAIDSDDINEIQIKDYDSIWVESRSHGGLIRLTHPVLEEGKVVYKPVTFGSMKRYKNWADRLLLEDNKKIRENNALIDAMTSEGIRVNVIAEHANVADKNTGSLEQRNYSPMVVTMRKQPKKKWSRQELVINKTFSRGISKTIEMIPNVKSSTFIVGATSSGKTVITNLLTDAIPYFMNIFCMGNPPELRIRKRNPITGMLLNNVIHVKATAWQGDIRDMPPGYPDILNFIRTAMRVTPDIAIMEEMRVYSEFERFISLATTGHCVFSTFHSESVVVAMTRLQVELQTANPALDRNSIIDIIAGFLKFVITQKKLPDNSRKVIEVAEICGTTMDETGQKQLKINYLYKFKRDAEPPFQGKPTREYLKRPVKGKHYRVGCLSNEMQERLVMEGFIQQQFDFLTKPLVVGDDGNPIPEEDDYIFESLFTDEEEDNTALGIDCDIESESQLFDVDYLEPIGLDKNSENLSIGTGAPAEEKNDLNNQVSEIKIPSKKEKDLIKKSKQPKIKEEKLVNIPKVLNSHELPEDMVLKTVPTIDGEKILPLNTSLESDLLNDLYPAKTVHFEVDISSHSEVDDFMTALMLSTEEGVSEETKHIADGNLKKFELKKK